MKTKEELSALKAEVATLNRKLADLTEEELAQVSGGFATNTEPYYNVGDIFLSSDGTERFEITRIGEKHWSYGFRYFGNDESFTNGMWCKIHGEYSYYESTLQFWSRIN